MNPSPGSCQSQVIWRPIPWAATTKAELRGMSISSSKGDTSDLEQARGRESEEGIH